MEQQVRWSPGDRGAPGIPGTLIRVPEVFRVHHHAWLAGHLIDGVGMQRSVDFYCGCLLWGDGSGERWRKVAAGGRLWRVG